MSVSFYVSLGQDAPELNVANGNFVRLMEILGYDHPEAVGEFTDALLLDLRHRVVFVLDSIKAMPDLDGGVPAQEISQSHIVCGIPDGYFERRLKALLALIDQAQASGQPLRWA